MEVHWPIGAISADALERGAAVRIVRGLLVCLLLLLGATALVFWARRAAGALREPLAPALLLLVGTMLALWAAAVRWLAGTLAEPATRDAQLFESARGRDRALAIGSWVCLVLAGAALSVSKTSVLGLVALWMPLAIGEAAAWSLHRHAGRPPHSPVAPEVAVPRSLVSDIGAVSDSSDYEEIEAEPEVPPDEISQRIVRSRDDQGHETIAGIVRAEFAAQQRTASAHVAFCPPLAGVPECFAQQIAGPTAEVKVTQVLPYGVRFDVRLDTPQFQPGRVTIEFAAREREQPLNPGRP